MIERMTQLTFMQISRLWYYERMIKPTGMQIWKKVISNFKVNNNFKDTTNCQIMQIGKIGL